VPPPPNPYSLPLGSNCWWAVASELQICTSCK
jgi:hypothetical protein